MPAARKCAQCGEPTLEPQKRRMEIYNSIYAYKCSNCSHEVELKPYGSFGVQVMVGFLLAPVVWLLFMDSHGNWPSLSNMPSLSQGLILLTIILYFPILTLLEMRRHGRYPLVDKEVASDHFEVEASSAITKKPVVLVERFGFLGGLLAPVILIVVVLGLAALVGYINFTYFNDQLFR